MLPRKPACPICEAAISETSTYIVYACHKRHCVHIECAYGAAICPKCDETRLANGVVAQHVTNANNARAAGAEMSAARRWMAILKRSRAERSLPVTVFEALHRSTFVQCCCAQGFPGAYTEDGEFLPVEPAKRDAETILEELRLARARGSVLSLEECFTGIPPKKQANSSDDEEDDDDDDQSLPLTGTHQLHNYASTTARERHLFESFILLGRHPTVDELRHLGVDFVQIRRAFSEILLASKRTPTVKEFHARLGLQVGALISLGATWMDLVAADLRGAIHLRGEDQAAPVAHYLSLAANDKRKRFMYEMVLEDVFGSDLKEFLSQPFTAEDFLAMKMFPSQFANSYHAKNNSHRAWAAVAQGGRMTPVDFICTWGWGRAEINSLVFNSIAQPPDANTAVARAEALLVRTMHWEASAINAALKKRDAMKKARASAQT